VIGMEGVGGCGTKRNEGGLIAVCEVRVGA